MQPRIGLGPERRKLVGGHHLVDLVGHEAGDAVVDRCDQGLQHCGLLRCQRPICRNRVNGLLGVLLDVDGRQDVVGDPRAYRLLNGGFRCQRCHGGHIAIGVCDLSPCPHRHHRERCEQAGNDYQQGGPKTAGAGMATLAGRRLAAGCAGELLAQGGDFRF